MKRLVKKSAPPQKKPLKRKQASAPAQSVLTLTYDGKVTGKKDPFREGCVMVDPKTAPSSPMFFRFNPDRTVPTSYYRFDKTKKRVTAVVSVMKDGLHVAWDTCGACFNYLHLCRCPNGISASRSVEYIFDSTNAILAGEEWSIHHPNYRGSLTAKQREREQKAREARYKPLDPSFLPPTTPAASEAGRTASRGLQTGKRRLSKRRDTVDDTSRVIKDGAVDMEALTDAANQAASDIEAEITKGLTKKRTNKTTKKVLRKKR